MQGGHSPPDEHGLAWSPGEWHLTPDTMALARFDAPAEPSNGGDAIQQSAHAKNGDGRPPETSRQAGPGSGSGAAGARDSSGASLAAKKRRGPQTKATRTCSAEGCSNAVPNRTQGTVLMCTEHRRATAGVIVRDCPELMRWCYHCKKPHGLSAFADSRIGVTRKLATCERGRQVRRINTAIKRVAARNLSAKAKRRCASPDDSATTTTTTAGVPASRPSTPRPPPGSDLQPGAWQHPGFAPVAFEISAPIHPSAVAGTGKRPFDFVAQLLSAVLGDDAGSGSRDENTSGSRSSSESLEMFSGEGEGEGEGDATLDPDLLLDPNPILPSLGASEMLDAARPPPVAPSSFVDFILDSAEAAILPGSVRLHVRSCVPTPHENSSAHLQVEALCKAVPSEGVFGARAVTVSVMSDAVLGHGWKTPSAGEAARQPASASASGSGSRSSDNRVVTFDAKTRVSSVPLSITPFPEWVRVPPVAVLGRPFHIRGLRGGETVHVFGQSMRPYSAVIPNAVGGGSLRVATLALADELGGIPGDHPVVPGFLRVQVLRPGQPAAGAECVNILLAEDDATALELDALRRGARVGACSILSVDDTCRELLEDAGLDAPLAPIAGFVSESAFERFAGDFARMVELHWRSRLYHPLARDAARRVMRLAARVFDRERAPAISGVLEDIVDDIDAQEEAEAEAEAEETRGGGFFRLSRRIGIPVGGDTLGSHQDKCTESRGSEIGSWSTRRVNVMDALGFRRFFALVQEDETAGESKEKTDMDGSACPIPTSTYIDVHRSLSTMFLVLVILGVLRAPDWGIKPSDIALLQLPALVLYCAPFAMGSRFGMTRAAIARLREWAVWAGLDGAFEAVLLAAIQLSNGIIRALVFFHGTNPLTGTAPDSRWIIASAVSTVNLTVYALFSAGASPPSRKRADVLVMGAMGSAAMVLPGPVIAPEAAARQGMFAPHGSVWSAATWLFLLPVACAMASRHAYRTFVGSVTRRKME